MERERTDEKGEAVKSIMAARLAADPEVLRASPAMRHVQDMEARARDVYATEQGHAVGVKERASQFVDKLIDRATESAASRAVLAMSARVVMDQSEQQANAVREREKALRNGPRDDAELAAAKDQRKDAESRASWATVPTSERERPLVKERTAELMAAVQIAAERETELPSAENRRKAALIEQELSYRRVEVASGARPIKELRPPQAESNLAREGARVLDKLESRDLTQDRSAVAERRDIAERRADKDLEIER